ncbi:hypothetical protein BJ166DRAFT_12114 [Pestalotiopsis sp. NC0098]|nr:hypothetical protein BJ166DRAFT_12114 [Pestalotiopsis sp. NC0098]
MPIIVKNKFIWVYERCDTPRRPLPAKFYRVHRECAFTEYIPAVPGQNLPFAFQARGSFDLAQELTRDRVERHLNWSDTAAPLSSFISVFDSYEKAQERADFHSHYAPRFRRETRVSIAEISTAGLVQTMFQSSASSPAIPIWVDRTHLHKTLATSYGGAPASPVAAIWVSVGEIRPVLGIPEGIGQDDEWLAFRHILRDRVDRIVPYDVFEAQFETRGEVEPFGRAFDRRLQAWNRTWTRSGPVEDSRQRAQHEAEIREICAGILKDSKDIVSAFMQRDEEKDAGGISSGLTGLRLDEDE